MVTFITFTLWWLLIIIGAPITFLFNPTTVLFTSEKLIMIIIVNCITEMHHNSPRTYVPIRIRTHTRTHLYTVNNEVWVFYCQTIVVYWYNLLLVYITSLSLLPFGLRWIINIYKRMLIFWSRNPIKLY